MTAQPSPSSARNPSKLTHGRDTTRGVPDDAAAEDEELDPMSTEAIARRLLDPVVHPKEEKEYER